jgi:hypothetical protein
MENIGRQQACQYNCWLGVNREKEKGIPPSEVNLINEKSPYKRLN